MPSQRSILVRPLIRPLRAIQWTHSNTNEVHEFIERSAWTTRYMSGAQGEAMYLHPKASWMAARTGEHTVRVGDWIVQGFGSQEGLVVVSSRDFADAYEVAA